jgi:ankyrin repeat protein
MCATFPNLGILHVTRKRVVDVLTDRFIQNKAMQITMQGMDPAQHIGEERDAARREADKVAKGMNLSVVRLCFQAYLPDERGYFRIPLDPVFSQKVYDSKAPSAATLKISRIDRPSGTVRGGDEVYLLCDKVQKNDIEVLFYEDEGYASNKSWEALGTFGPQDVHHQYAIVFKTPPFYNLAIERPHTVNIALRRPSDKEMSDPKQFTYLPQEFDEERIGMKRKKKIDHFTDFFSRGGGGGGGGMPTGGPSGGMQGGNSGQQGSFFSGLYSNYSFTGNSSYGGNQGGQPQVEFQAPFRQGIPPQQPPSVSGGMFGPSTGHEGAGFEVPFTSQPGYSGQGAGMMEGIPHRNPPPYGTAGGSNFGGSSSGFWGQEGQFGGSSRGGEDSQQPPRHSKVELEKEDLESGYGEPTNLTSLDKVQEDLMQQLLETKATLLRRQQQAFEVCERLTRALMEWARTKDVRYLLAAQQDITAVQNNEGDTALNVAIINRHEEAVRVLLDVLPQLPETSTAVIDMKNHLNQAPLHLAVLTKQSNIVEILLKANANTMTTDRNGNTPLHIACQLGSPIMARLLVTCKQGGSHADRNHPELSMLNIAGYSPLHLAVLCGKNVDTLKELIVTAGADPNVQDSKSGRSPLHLAAERGDLAMTGFLLVQRHILAGLGDYHGNTPLHLAAGCGHLDCVNLLITSGVNVAMVNAEGETPLDLARMKGHQEVIDLLESEMSRIDQDIVKQLGSVTIEEQPPPQPPPPEYMPKMKREPGDMWMLPMIAKVKLSLMLDAESPGRDWRALAERLGYSRWISGFQVCPTPTRELLSYFEDGGGLVQDLSNQLNAIGRSDVDRVLRQALEEFGVKLASPKSSEDSNSAGPMIGNPFISETLDTGVPTPGDINSEAFNVPGMFAVHSVSGPHATFSPPSHHQP